MKKIALLVTVFMIPFMIFSQKTLKEWSEVSDKKFSKKFQYGTALGYVKKDIKSPEMLPDISKVGWLSYAMFQPNFTQKNSSYVKYLTDDGEAFIIDLLWGKAQPGLISAFEKHNIELLSIDEYVDTPEKKERFKNETFEPSKLTKATWKLAKSLGGTVKGYDAKGTPKGHKFLVEAHGDPKVYRAVGKFAGEMGVDAVFVVEQTIFWSGKIFALGPMKMMLIGPNPVPYNENTKYVPLGPLKGYMEGIVYGWVMLTPPKSYEIARIKKKKVDSIDLEGLDIVYSKVFDNLMNYINDEFAKAAK